MTISAAAIKQRRYRDRLRAGRVLVTLELDQVMLEEALVSGGFLEHCQTDDPDLVRQAAQRAFEVLIEAG